jgi:CarD family transcriptional regulator
MMLERSGKMYSVGDKVMHCAHGAGVITDKKEMQITDTPHCYLVIELLGSGSTLMVPTDQAEERLRPACERVELRRLLTSELAGDPQEMPGDYRERQKYIEEKLKSGKTKAWIGVIRDLAERAEQNPLSSGDQKYLDRAVDLVSGELALAQGIPQQEAMPRLKSMVERRHQLADRPIESPAWWQTLGQRVMEPFGRSSMGTG